MNYQTKRYSTSSTFQQWAYRCVVYAAIIFAIGTTSPLNAQEESLQNLPNLNTPFTIELPLNKVHPIALPRTARDVIVANPEIADVIVKTQTTAYIIGRATGDTDILFIDDTGDVINHIIVRVDLDVAAAAAAIRDVIPSANVTLKSINNSIVITGVVQTAKESSDINSVASRFIEEGFTVVNLIEILGDQQVLLQVRIAEMQRNVLKNLGLNTSWTRTINDGDFLFDITTAGLDTLNFEGVGTIGINDNNIPSVTYSALERQGLVKTLAEPVLTAVSGQTANFLAGGEFPSVGGIDSTGNTIIEFREFGVRLEFTPVVMSNDHINLRVAAEVSRLSEENKLTVPIQQGASSIDIIGLSARNVESTVTLPSGGSLMIAGLLQNDEFTSIDGVPWLQDIPILGALFRSPAFQRNQSELIILVEALLVRPTDNQQPLALPTDGFVTPSDFDLMVLGRLYKQYGGDKSRYKCENANNSNSVVGILRDIRCEIPLIGGPIGYFMR